MTTPTPVPPTALFSLPYLKTELFISDTRAVLDGKVTTVVHAQLFFGPEELVLQRLYFLLQGTDPCILQHTPTQALAHMDLNPQAHTHTQTHTQTHTHTHTHTHRH